MAKAAFNYDSYDLQLDVQVTGEIPGSQNEPGGPRHGEQNKNVWFFPLGIILEGPWKIRNECSNRPPGALNAIGGEIPGQRLLIDTRARQVKVIHKLTLPENAGKVAKLKELAGSEQFPFAKFTHLPKDQDFSASSDNEWASLLFAVRRLVDAGNLHFVKGEAKLPQIEDIRKIGDVTHAGGVWMSNSQDQFWKLPKVNEEALVGAGK